jgi:DNA processing protein
MNEEHAALVALLRTRPLGLNWRKLTDEVLEYGSAAAVWDYHHPPQLIPSPETDAALESARTDLEAWERAGLRFISALDKEFPQRLLDIWETPPFLFAQGRVAPEDLGLSVVGSRKASAYGLDMARGIATYLAGQGLTVISGLAAGIDAAAHSAAIAASGRTVAFIATGVTRNYPQENRELQAQIVDDGLVLSQFWPDAPPRKQHFLMRNALMSGYGLATIVVEAGETSGARAQARMAVEHGRPVILTNLVIEKNEWARALVGRPGVSVVSGVREIGPIVERILSEPQRMDEALRLPDSPVSNAAALAQLRDSLVESAGGYLRNILHVPDVTCEICAKPVGGYRLCGRCQWNYASRTDIADRVGSMIYAFDGQQSGRLMYGYKAAYARPSHVQTVTSLAVLGIREHRQCVDRLLGATVTRWATVPSLRKPGTEHAFRTILTGKIKAGSEIEVVAAPREKIQSPREVTPTNYVIRTEVPEDAHVMVLDDTWVGGGHTQSVAAALKLAGAGKVSRDMKNCPVAVMKTARWWP